MNVASQLETMLQDEQELLGVTIEKAIGRAPDLRVAQQTQLSGDYPGWLVPPLAGAKGILFRRTGYAKGSLMLSHNLAYVDLERVGESLAGDLVSERIHLGTLFAAQAVERFNFVFGTDEDAGEIGDAIREDLSSRERGPFMWRLYNASIDDSTAFVVIESLPLRSWKKVLSGAELDQVRESSG